MDKYDSVGEDDVFMVRFWSLEDEYIKLKYFSLLNCRRFNCLRILQKLLLKESNQQLPVQLSLIHSLVQGVMGVIVSFIKVSVLNLL